MTTQPRYYSLDIFRGATVALMILVNNPGSWSHMFAPLQHAPWHGCTPTDLVFPFFLFAVGNAMAFVMPRLQEAGAATFWKKVLKRAVLIFLIGLGLNWFPFVVWSGDGLVFKEWVSTTNVDQGIRLLGVLQRIAIAYLGASILAYYLKPKALIYTAIALLFGYWVLCAMLGIGDPYSLSGWFGTEVDKLLLGVPHMYKGEGVPFDPEGIVSTWPSVVQVIFGYLTGVFILKRGEVSWLWKKVPTSAERHFKLISSLMVTAFIVLVLGWVWSLGFPINKKIWTSSYVLYTTGLAIMTLSAVIWYTDLQGARNALTRFFDVFGKNPLFIFVLSGMLPRISGLIRMQQGVDENDLPIYTTPLGWFYDNVCVPLPGPPEVGSFFYSLCFLVVMWLICAILDRKKIYIKV